jgi:hypothetical protein
MLTPYRAVMAILGITNRYGSLIEETVRFLLLGDFCVAKTEANHGT